ncbi:uncharacterized protein LOC120712540 isoform X1 [Panicum virgatum]|uniref:uncharacterized protein LOC120712540 isoform X1 n=1 Tax=Panicum virgatum TaxID=38727 RepID=UPI0019D5E618|nr:uncharacterized protein LOC120712540 isoform X1 [Panicum virgatum]
MASEEMTATEVAALLDLKPHPEGGFYAETFRDGSVTLSTAQLPPQWSALCELGNSSRISLAVRATSLCVTDVCIMIHEVGASGMLGNVMVNLPDKVDRAVSTAIYFLLPAGSVSRLHRIPCAETWHFYKGEPLTVFELHDDGHIDLTVIGPHLEAGQRPQYTVPPNVWFGSFPTLDVESFASDGSVLVKSRKRDPEQHYSLVGCTCAPGFQYEDFEMATFEDVRSIAPKAEPFLKFLIPSTE